MAEYIDRERLLRRFNIDDMMNVNGTLISMNDARDTISNFPTADVAPVVHGIWIEKPFLMGISRFCSNCGDNFGMPHGVYRYCPTCGAKMDLEESTDA